MSQLQWVYHEDDVTEQGGYWHAKSYALRRGRPSTDDRQTALTVGYDAAPDIGPEAEQTDGYLVGISYGVWTDATEDNEGFVEGVQNIFDRGEVGRIGLYDTEAEAQLAMTAFTTLVSTCLAAGEFDEGALAALGETWGDGPEAALPGHQADAREAFGQHIDKFRELVPDE